MFASTSHRRSLSGAPIAMVLLSLGLSGCAEMGENMTSAFVDPARYDLYECKQLGPERKQLAARTAELKGLMAKAETGAGGSVVAEMAYRNDYIAVRGQSKLAEEAWQRNKCQEVLASDVTPGKPVAPSVSAKGPRLPSRSGSAAH